MLNRPRRPQGGFTLIELLVVMTVIGLILSFILVAGYQGLRSAEVKATVGLLAKLDAALADRTDALLALSPQVTEGHRLLAAIPIPPASGAYYIPGEQRAQVIALVDMLRAEMPDVFFYDSSNTNYPINFAGMPYDPTGTSPFALPAGVYTPPFDPNSPTGYSGIASPVVTGMYGATFAARAGIAKGLGTDPLTNSSVTDPRGYNGVDDSSPPNGLVDEFSEWTQGNATVANVITANMGRHTHKTARAEALYAMLVEGSGPLGSYFSADDFTSREVKDTDGDGLLEFIDAWGEPLQFFRWPIYFGTEPGTTGVVPTFGSDIQKGYYPYNDPAGTLPENREQNPLDPNQQLVAPNWFSGLPPGTTPTPVQAPGANATQFQNLFFSLVDPLSASPGLWDRGGLYKRRAYNYKPLILSGGPDKVPGVGRFPTVTGAQALIQIENQAARADTTRTGTFSETPNRSSAATVQILSDGQDDLTNHGSATTGAVR